MTRVGLLFAAGHSRRFGASNKLLAPLRGEPLVRHAARAMLQATLDHCIAVVKDDEVASFLEGFHLVRLTSEDTEQSDSLRAGLRHAMTLGADRLLVALADMPNISSEVLNAVIDKCTDGDSSATTDGHRRMPPACFPKAVFPELALSVGDRGAKQVLRSTGETQLVEVDPEMLADIDTPDTLKDLNRE